MNCIRTSKWCKCKSEDAYTVDVCLIKPFKTYNLIVFWKWPQVTMQIKFLQWPYLAKKKSDACGQEVICIGILQERRACACFATYTTLLASSLFLSQICIVASLKQNTPDASCIHFDSFDGDFWKFSACISDQVYPVANMRHRLANSFNSIWQILIGGTVVEYSLFVCGVCGVCF